MINQNEEAELSSYICPSNKEYNLLGHSHEHESGKKFSIFKLLKMKDMKRKTGKNMGISIKATKR